MKKYSTVLFDFDGTIAHSEIPLIHTIRETLNHHGYEYEKYKHTLTNRSGRPIIDVYDELFGSDKAKLMRETHKKMQRNHLHKYSLLDGALETLKTLKKNDVSTAIVTSANKEKIDALVDILHIAEYFDYTISLEDVSEAKPNPEGIQRAMTELRAEPQLTVMVGDSPNDIKAANQAGIDSIFITTNIAKLHDLISTYTIDEFDQILPIVGLGQPHYEHNI
ncbi:MAG: HAD family hydrolase [Candidatus Roizmanbacteria bacterium]